MYQPGSLVLEYCRVMLRWVLSLHSRALEGCSGPAGWSARGRGGGNIVVHGPEQPSLIWVFSSPVSYQKTFRNSLIVPGMGLGCV